MNGGNAIITGKQRICKHMVVMSRNNRCKPPYPLNEECDKQAGSLDTICCVF